MLGKGCTYSKLGDTKQSLDQYTSQKIWENYLARRGIMLGNGETYLILGRTKQSLDHYRSVRNRVFPWS